MDIDIRNFLKVHNPREDFPNISGSIEIQRNVKFGRMIVATEDLLPGTVICIEEPFFMSLDKKEVQTRCGLCLKKLISSVTCPSCKSLKFCSEKCQINCYKYFHKFECANFHELDSDDNFLLMMNRMLYKSISTSGSLEELNTIIETIDKSLTLFDSTELKIDKKLLSCCFNLECGNVKDDFTFIDSCVKSPFLRNLITSKYEQDILKKIILKILGILNRNSFTISFKTDSAGALYPFASLINHSCSPNLDKINLGNKALFISNKPINKHEQLFLSYRRPFYFDSVQKRQKSIYRQFNFTCECEACRNDELFTQYYESSSDLKNISKINSFKLYRASCIYIQNNIKDYPNLELIQAIYSNKKFLQNVLDEY
ncbi:unnamed protein product [Chironomus riparius]|uniref:Uncharacterized protein n=1 Tax=Chironomus riparius TaxID=315576 RepID=A0A9N9RP94_9DIPT|nr:unnamed protein product [Chironomus riparius]